jgi:hypothetical protein
MTCCAPAKLGSVKAGRRRLIAKHHLAAVLGGRTARQELLVGFSISETPPEPCQRQITAQDQRQDAPIDALRMDRSQTSQCTRLIGVRYRCS